MLQMLIRTRVIRTREAFAAVDEGEGGANRKAQSPPVQVRCAYVSYNAPAHLKQGRVLRDQTLASTTHHKYVLIPHVLVHHVFWCMSKSWTALGAALPQCHS